MIDLKTPLVLGAAVITFAACEHDRATPKAAAFPAASVRVQTVSLRQDASFLTAIGRVKNVRESMVAAKAMGRVQSIRVKAGDEVKKGSVLLRVDPADARARFEQAQGALTQAQAARRIAKQMLDRFETLKQKNAASASKYDKAQFDYQSASGAVVQAQGGLRQAQAYLRETTVVAPFAGKVVDTMIEEGEMASPGMPLVKLQSQGTLEFEATMSSQDVFQVELGMPVTVTLDAARGEQRSVDGKVSEVVPAEDLVTHSNLVRINLGASDWIRSGMFGRVSFEQVDGSCPGILVPVDRLVSRGQLDAVYVVDEVERVRLRLIKAGRVTAKEVEVLAGLSEGDRLVVSDISNLIDGQPASVQP